MDEIDGLPISSSLHRRQNNRFSMLVKQFEQKQDSSVELMKAYMRKYFLCFYTNPKFHNKLCCRRLTPVIVGSSELCYNLYGKYLFETACHDSERISTNGNTYAPECG